MIPDSIPWSRSTSRSMKVVDKPKLDIVTISSVEQNDLNELNNDFFGLADFIICINENMTKTH